jgi:hypothetical protein
MKFDISVFLENLCRKFNFVEIWEELRVRYMNTDVGLKYLAQLFLEREMFRTKIVDEIKPTFYVQ